MTRCVYYHFTSVQHLWAAGCGLVMVPVESREKVVCGFAVAGSTRLILSSVGYPQGNWRHTHRKYESLIPTFCISHSVSTRFPPSVSRVSSGIGLTHQMVQLVRPKKLFKPWPLFPQWMTVRGSAFHVGTTIWCPLVVHLFTSNSIF